MVKKYLDGYVAYPLGLTGIVVSEGDTYEETLADVKSAIRFHIESFGTDIFQSDSPVIEAFLPKHRLLYYEQISVRYFSNLEL